MAARRRTFPLDVYSDVRRRSVVPLAHAVLVVLFVGFAFGAHAAEMGTPKSVLILFSNGRPLPGVVAIDNTLRRVVQPLVGYPVEMFDEFLDVERFGNTMDPAKMAEFLNLKYRKLNIGVIVAAGPEALRFALAYGDSIVPDIPLVHVNVTREDLSAAEIPPDVIGWTVDLDPTATLDLAERLHPHATELVIVTGASGTDRALERRIRNAVAGLKNPPQVTFLAGLPTTEVLRRLRALTKNAIVYTPGYYVDGSGHVSTPRQAVEQMAAASGAPIYGPYDTFLGSGIVGGYMATFEAQSKQAGEAVAALLNGIAPAAITHGSMPNTFMVDWRQVQRWGIDESALPAEADIRFREPSVLARYRWQIIAIAAALVLQSLLIARLLIERRRRRVAEIESRQRYSEMAHMNRSVALGELSASIAHEINQPLGAILNNANAAELLLKASPPALDEVAEILGDIKRDDERAGEVVKRIRGLLRKSSFELKDVDLNETVDETLKFLVADASVKGFSVRTDLARGLAPVRADPIQIGQVILNLALNAMDAMVDAPVGGRTLVIRTARAETDCAELSVIDSGPGIPPETADRIFDAFYSTKQHGMGLGLSISRTIVEAHGGQIYAANSPRGGATFRFTLPFAGKSAT